MVRLADGLLRGWALLVTAVVALPLVVVVVISFGEGALIALPTGGLTLRWYAEVLAWPAFRAAAANSLIIAGVVGAASTLTGTLAALGLLRLGQRQAGGAMTLLTLPVMLPPLVLGIALLGFYVAIGLRLSLLTVMLSHLVITQPYVVLVVYARLATFDMAILDSARDLGAGPVRAFLTVMLPVIAPSVVGAALFAVAVSLEDFMLAFMTLGGGNTLPTLVFGMVRTTLDPRVNAIATMLVAGTVAASVLALRLTRYRG